MGQIETKLHSSVPAKYLEFALDNTQLQPEAVQICWAFWRRDSRSEDGKLDLEEFSSLLDTLSSSSEDDR